MPTLGDFIDCVWGPGSDPVVVGATGQHQHQLLQLRQYVANPHALPEYIVPATPTWFSGAATQLNNPAVFQRGEEVDRWREAGYDAHSMHCCGFPRQSNLLVIECDYLLVPKGDEAQYVGDGEGQIPPDEVKQAQAQAIQTALVATGFPFTALVHSGSKSIHIYVACTEPIDRPLQVGGFTNCPQYLLTEREQRERINEQREQDGSNRRWALLQESLRLALGDYDIKVLQGSGLAWKCRMPGALRSTGAEQSILACDPTPRSVNDIYNWCLRQLNKETRLWLEDHQRRVTGYKNSKLVEALSLEGRGGWRDLVCRRVAQGSGGHGFESARNQWLSASSKLVATQKRPRINRRPCIEQGDLGDIDAPFLWWVQACAINSFSLPLVQNHPQAPCPYGYVFTGQDWWWRGKDNRGSSDIREVWDLLSEPTLNTRLGKVDEYIDVWYEQQQQQVQERAEWIAAGADRSQTPDSNRAIPPGARTGPTIGAAPSHLPQNEAGENEQEMRMSLMLHRLGKGFPVAYASSKAQPFRKEWVRYNGRYWESVSEEYARSMAYWALKQMPMRNSKGIPAEPSYDATNEIYRMASLRDEGRYQFNGEWQQKEGCIVFDNGTMYVTRDRCDFKRDHFDPEDYATFALPYPYDPMMATPMFDHYLATSFQHQWERDIVMRWLGYLFYPGLPFKNMLMLKGDTDTGKSTLNNIMTALIGGKGFTKSLDLQVIARDNYWASGLETARLIVINETAGSMSTARDVTAKIKKLTGDDTINIRKMQKDGFDHRVTSKLVITTNTLPQFQDDSEAVWKRCLLIEPVLPAKIIDGLADMVEKELPGVAAKAIAALQVLLAEGGFHKPEEMERRVKDYREDNSPLRNFWEEYMVEAPGEYCALKAVMRVIRSENAGNFSNERTLITALKDNKLIEHAPRRGREWVEKHHVHHMPKTLEAKSAYILEGWRCCHPRADYALGIPTQDPKTVGTADDKTPIPFPRRGGGPPLPPPPPPTSGAG